MTKHYCRYCIREGVLAEPILAYEYDTGNRTIQWYDCPLCHGTNHSALRVTDVAAQLKILVRERDKRTAAIRRLRKSIKEAS